jgi:hypothetical protein
MMNSSRTYSIFLALVLVVVGPTMGLADDVGITKARLIQHSETRYVIEADVTQALAWAIKAPIFPDRFQVSELEYLTQSGWIVVQATATTNGEPLAPQDEILLPWMRNGVALTAQWLDGSVQQGLFLRSLEGIHVPLRVLMPSDTSLRDVCLDHLRVVPLCPLSCGPALCDTVDPLNRADGHHSRGIVDQCLSCI